MSTIVEFPALHRNESATFELQVTIDGTDSDLTGLYVGFKLYSFDDDEAAELFERSTSNGGIVIDPDQVENPGKAVLTITTGNTNLPPRGYMGRVWVEDRVACYGILQIRP